MENNNLTIITDREESIDYQKTDREENTDRTNNEFKSLSPERDV